MNRNSKLLWAVSSVAIVLLVVVIVLFTQLQSKSTTAPQVREALDKNGRPVPTSYERNEIKNTIVKNAPTIQECYKALLARDADFPDGTVKIDWQISPEGKASKASVIQSQYKDLDFEKCLIAKINEWVFPPPPNQSPYYAAHVFRFKASVK